MSRWIAVALVLSVGCGAGPETGRRAASPAPQPVATANKKMVEKERSRVHPVKRLRLGRLPDRGFVVGSDKGVSFLDLEGRVVKELPRFELNDNQGAPGVWFKSGRIYFQLHASSGMLVPVSAHKARSRMHEGPAPKLPAPPGSRIKGVGIVGHWRYALPRYDGAVLAQWSGECEVPIAYWIAHGDLQVVTGGADMRHAPESIALGWSDSGAALVYLGDGLCGGRGDPPGIYSFLGPGDGRLIYQTPRYARVEMWR